MIHEKCAGFRVKNLFVDVNVGGQGSRRNAGLNCPVGLGFVGVVDFGATFVRCAI